jgi:hypothetical protein
MEQNSTNKLNLTEEQLRDAGASEAYISYYLAAKRLGISTNSTNHAEKVVEGDVSYGGGGFHDALWSAEPRWSGDNPYGADDTNKRILREAGVYRAPA